MLASVVSLAFALRAFRRLPDQVTLLRGLGLVVLLGVAFANPWIGWGLAAIVAMLDLVDGALARRVGPTDAGALFDMETDQLVVATLALLVVCSGGTPHVLLLPMMRPAFVLVAWQMGLPANDAKPVDGDNQRGKLVCAAVVVALLVALLPGIASWLRDATTGIAVLLLIWSFSSDWKFLIERHRRPGGLDGSR